MPAPSPLLAFSILLLGALAARPASRPDVVKVAVLLSESSPPYVQAERGFAAAFSDAGQTLHMETRVVDAVTGGVSGEWGSPPDLVLALGSPALRAALRNFPRLPIVGGMVLKPAELQGTNLTGVYLEFPPDVQFHWLQRLLPRAARVGVLYNAAENQGTIERAEQAARSAGIRLYARPIVGPSDIPSSLASLENQADVLWGLADTLALTPETARPLLLFSLKNRIPFVGLSEAWVRAGALYALDRDYEDVGRQCGELAGRIVAGQPAASIPAVAPRRVVYVVSRRAAELLGIHLADDVLRGARAVLQ